CDLVSDLPVRVEFAFFVGNLTVCSRQVDLSSAKSFRVENHVVAFPGFLGGPHIVRVAALVTHGEFDGAAADGIGRRVAAGDTSNAIKETRVVVCHHDSAGGTHRQADKTALAVMRNFVLNNRSKFFGYEGTPLV